LSCIAGKTDVSRRALPWERLRVEIRCEGGQETKDSCGLPYGTTRQSRTNLGPLNRCTAHDEQYDPIAGIETMHMIKKGQLRCSKGLVVADADRFYSHATP
jgi:hypothetical protein